MKQRIVVWPQYIPILGGFMMLGLLLSNSGGFSMAPTQPTNTLETENPHGSGTTLYAKLRTGIDYQT